MLDRREFIKIAACLSAAFGLGSLPEPVAAALKKIDPGTIPKLLYLQGQTCSGCSVSLLQAESPAPLTMITDYCQLAFHSDLSATSGRQAIELIEKFVSGQAGQYILALEGAIPYTMPEACVIGNRTLAEYLKLAASTMTAAVAIGACASDGGIPGAEGNLTGAVGLQEFFKRNAINKLVVNIRGCSVNPDWVWDTIVRLVKIGLPELTAAGAPASFFTSSIHETCCRYHDFQEEIFAEKLGDSGCLFKLGCLGPLTQADCSSRWWNGGRSYCVLANAPCIGCASPLFARKKDMPFYRITQFG